MNYRDNNDRLQRWALKLQAYDFEIVCQPGRIHNNTDALSRTQHGPYLMSVEPQGDGDSHGCHLFQ